MNNTSEGIDVKASAMRFETFSYQRLLSAEQLRAGASTPHPAGAVVLELARRDIWLTVIDRGRWLEISSPHAVLTLRPGCQLQTLGDTRNLLVGACKVWLDELQDFLELRAATPGPARSLTESSADECIRMSSGPSVGDLRMGNPAIAGSQAVSVGRQRAQRLGLELSPPA